MCLTDDKVKASFRFDLFFSNMNPSQDVIDAPESTQYRVPSVESACRIIRYVAAKREAVPLKELIEAAATSRTTTLRIASSLVENGFLDQVAKNHFKPGVFLHELSDFEDPRQSLIRHAAAILEPLAITNQETAHLALPLETHCILEQVIHSPRPIRVASTVGSLVDFHCSATGKSMLAFDDVLRRSLRGRIELTARTKNTLCDWEALENDCALIRSRGYAIDEQEYHEGVRCVAVPLIRPDQSVIGAIGMTGATTTLTKRRIAALAKDLTDAAAELLKST